jgi:hypothetical protein
MGWVAAPNYWPKRKAATLKPVINKIGGWLMLCEKYQLFLIFIVMKRAIFSTFWRFKNLALKIKAKQIFLFFFFWRNFTESS